MFQTTNQYLNVNPKNVGLTTYNSKHRVLGVTGLLNINLNIWKHPTSARSQLTNSASPTFFSHPENMAL
jgi:hypothetical protein